MIKASRTLLIFGTLVLNGCAGNMPPVPLVATGGESALLTGTWDGTYEMTTGSRRSGSILFELQAGRDSASGTVVMTYNYMDRQPALMRVERDYIRSTQSAPLAISFVRLTGTRISGELQPYTDPFCGCRLRTTFTGTVRGDVITGTFVTMHLDSGHSDQGKWKVVREKANT